MDLAPTQFSYNRYRFWLHCLFWIFSVLTYTLIYGSYNSEYITELKINLIALPVKMAATYSTIYILMPLFFFTRRYIWFLFLLIASAIIFSTLEWAVLYHFAFSVFCPEKYTDWNYSFFHDNLSSIIHIYPIVIVAASVKIVQVWFKNMEHTKQLENEKLEAELKFLKGQIHPHFLFNTLNNLYALTLKKSDQAPEVVIKLSGLLDYMLYEGDSEYVPLTQELKHLGNYIELERLRYGKKLTFQQTVTGDAAGKKIAPLILLPFIENSFKHGASSGVKNPQISISITIETDHLQLRVENSKENQTLAERSPYSEGIGLNNVKRRLELLYPSGYELKIDDQPDRFTILLTLALHNSQ